VFGNLDLIGLLMSSSMRAESADDIRDGAYFDVGIGLGVESDPFIFDDRNASGLDYANALDDAPNSEIMLSYWPQSSLYSITLNSFVDLALPDEMLQTLKQNEVVMLETKNSILFHYLLKNKNQILVLESPHSFDPDDFSSEKSVLTLSFYVCLILLFLIWAYPLMKQLSSLRKVEKLSDLEC
jgi:hypothetical protein